jgi:hypothetical protein
MKLLLSFTMLFSLATQAQTVKGIVLDGESKKPIPYVNIGMVNKNRGTVSLEDGQFEILLDEKYGTDTLRFSSIGYSDKSFLVKDFLNLPSKIVTLNPKTIVLNEVVITNEPKKAIVLGHLPKSKFTKAGFFFNGLGHEIGTLFENEVADVQYLDSIQLNFVTCNYDSIFIRLNIYSVDGDETKNILPTNVLLGMSRKKVLSRPVIDLSQFNLVVGKKFLISIEIIKDLGASGLKFYAVLKAEKNITLFRATSQAKWETALHKERPIGISLLAFVH